MLLPFLKRLTKYFLQYKTWFWTLMAAIVVNSVSEAMLPLVWKSLIDSAISNADKKDLIHTFVSHISFSFILVFIGYYAVLILLNVGSEKIMTFQTGRLCHYVMRDLRSQMFEKMQRLSYSYYDKTSAGWLVARLTYDSERLSELMTWGFINFFGAIVMIVASLVAMFLCNVRLTLIVVFILPILLYVSVKLRVMVLKYARESRRLNSELTGFFTENLNAIEVVKSYAIEDYRFDGFKDINSRLKDASLKTSMYSALFAPIVVLMGSVVAGCILYMGGNMTFAGSVITIGTFGAFFAYVRSIFMPIFDIARTYSMALNSLSAGERIFSLIDEPVVIKDAANAISNHVLSGDIRYDKVCFGYVPHQKVLVDFDLHIKPGESIALVGPSGEGKTTLVNLLCRFYEVGSGGILVDGINIKNISSHSYLQQVGIIPQVAHVFSGTIRDNICFSVPNATDQEIEHTLELIGAKDLIERLYTEVGTEGEGLSNGEKQMISFARAIIKRPQILIMDEATSSMDAITEQKVRQSIQSIIHGRTAIVIAHRLSTIRECNRILFIKHGKIAEQGTHFELMSLKGNYYRFYSSYSRDISEIKTSA